LSNLKTTAMANLQNALSLATELLKEKGLYQQGWRATTTRQRRGMGVCRYRQKEIGLSAINTPHGTDDAVWNTITHEVAHALAGHEAGHGWKWQQIHRELGGNGQRLATNDYYIGGEKPKALIESKHKPAYIGLCPNGHTHYRYKYPTRTTTCGQCSRRYDERYKITWERN
jgi:SprT protein